MTRERQRPPSLRLRLAAWSTALVTLVSVLLTVTYQVRLGELLTREADERTRTLGHHLAANAQLGVLAASNELLQAVIDGALESPDVVALAIYSDDGTRLAAGGRQDAQPPPFEAVKSECGPCREGDDLLRWVTPVTRRASGEAFFGGDEDPPRFEVAGHLVMDVSGELRRQDAQALLARGVLVFAGVLLLGLAVALVLAQRLTAPLRTLAQAARQVGRGEWEVHLPDRAPGELSRLSDDFRAMTADLQRLDEENRDYRENLEEMVASRTEELERAYENLKALNKEKDDFVATVSHDFRSPLAIILSMIQTILAEPDMPQETTRRFLGRVERQCKRLEALVSDLLDLARMENRRAELATHSLHAVVAELLEATRPTFADRGVTLSLFCEGAVPARVDRMLLERALGNLLDNALKFTPESGSVTVRVGKENGSARIDVCDSGVGIAEDDLPRVFDRFFQSDRDSASGEGSGLGLAIVAEVMRKHGGRVEVSSKLGEGATFTLFLPMEE